MIILRCVLVRWMGRLHFIWGLNSDSWYRSLPYNIDVAVWVVKVVRYFLSRHLC